MEEELKRDHAEMQAVIEAKQKVIDAQVQTHTAHLDPPAVFKLGLTHSMSRDHDNDRTH